MHLYLHSLCELSMCFKLVILQNVICKDLKSCQFCHNLLCVAFYGQYTIGVLNSINVLGDKTFAEYET